MVVIPDGTIGVIVHEINLGSAEALFAALEARLTDMTPVMDTLGEYLVGSTKARFPQGVSPEGVKWAPKSPATLERYGIRKSNRVDIRPLFGPSGMLSSQIFHQAAADRLEWGSNMIYSAVMQFGAARGAFGTMANGSPIPWGDIPARPFLGISAEDERYILETLAEWVEEAGGASP